MQVAANIGSKAGRALHDPCAQTRGARPGHSGCARGIVRRIRSCFKRANRSCLRRCCKTVWRISSMHLANRRPQVNHAAGDWPGCTTGAVLPTGNLPRAIRAERHLVRARLDTQDIYRSSHVADVDGARRLAAGMGLRVSCDLPGSGRGGSAIVECRSVHGAPVAPTHGRWQCLRPRRHSRHHPDQIGRNPR